MSRTAIAAAALLGVAIVAHVGGLPGPFFLDDHTAIEQNPQLGTLSTSFSAPKDTAFAGRPIASLSMALSHAASGLDPRGFRAGNLLIHGLAGLLLWGVLRRTLRMPGISPSLAEAADPLALCIAILWLVHPVQTEIVNYATQRTEALLSLFYLATLYAAIRARGVARGTRIVWTALAIGAAFLGTASKESMMTVPVAVVLFDLAYGSTWRDELRSRLPLWIGVFASWGLLAFLLQSAPRGGSVGFDLGVSSLDYALEQVRAVARYLGLIVWPHPLVLDYGVSGTLAERPLWPAALALGLAGFGSALLFVRSPRLGFPAIWFFLLLAPTSSVVPIPSEVAAERRMSLALAGPLALGVWAGDAALRRMLGGIAGRRVGLAVVAAVALVWLGLDQRRHAEYRSAESIWRTVTERMPESYRGHSNLGIVLAAEGRLDEAIESLAAALRVEPGHARSYYTLGVVFGMQGRTEEAIQALRRATRIDPNHALAHQSLGILLEGAGQTHAAAAGFREALAIDPSLERAALRLAWIEATSADPKLRDPARAVRRAADVRRSAPLDPLVHEVLARALAESGESERARAVALAGAELAATRGDAALAEQLRTQAEYYATSSDR